MIEIQNLLSGIIPSVKGYIPDPILSGIDKLPDFSGYGILIAIVLLLPVLRTFSYTFIQPLGTVTNSFASAFSIVIRTLFQMFSTISITFTSISMSWINALNRFFITRSNYFILILTIFITALGTCLYLEKRIDIYIILISFTSTTLLYLLYKHRLL